MRNLTLALSLALATTAIASAATAQAPEPRQSINIDRFMGRWYEILRTPNGAQRNCHGANQTWSRRDDGTFNVSLVCHRDTPAGRASTINSRSRILDNTTNAKFEASFFGGVLRRQYWVIDRGANYEWMIASSADGEVVSLLSRTPNMPTAQVQTLTNRIRSLGFRSNTLVAVDH